MAVRVLTADDTTWEWYADAPELNLDPSKCGKWIYEFSANSLARVRKLCRRAVAGGHIRECKHTGETVLAIEGSGIICFYLESGNTKGHRDILSFMMKNNLIPKHGGRYCDIRFKLDSETATGIYSDDAIYLSDLVDLSTGEFFGSGAVV